VRPRIPDRVRVLDALVKRYGIPVTLVSLILATAYVLLRYT